MTLDADDRRRLRRLRRLLDEVRARGPRRAEGPLEELPRLYRHACSALARLETRGVDPRAQDEVRLLVLQAHELLAREWRAAPRTLARRCAELFLVQGPRAIRAEWRLVLASAVLFYGLAASAFAGVARDLDLAFSLLDARVVAQEIEQLEGLAPGQTFRGNFDFGLGESPATAGRIMVHNMGVGMIFFASSLLPPLYLLILVKNALMVGTYTAVAGHWGQAGAISSHLWCHGAIELQMILLAGTAGLVLVRALLAPGPFSRRHALTVESRRAWHVLAPVFPLLFLAGLIEGYVTPHAPLPARLAVAGGSVVGLAAWVALGGRAPQRTGLHAARRP